jgi:A/G-specific adenine glycosylase
MYPNNDKVRQKLLSWFKENQRVLPWRGHGSAYKTWLSEIIMQQTRVAQGTPYYERFIKSFPEVADLAAADEQEVLKLWQGLGYYSRARNLHHAAKTIITEHGGLFPSSYKEILKLKGIGPYTAAAIASIAFNKPHAALDGNVYRVLARLFGIIMPINANGAAKFYQHLADELLDKKEPGPFNEAMMEFGATLCLPKNPLCHICPLSDFCEAYKKGTQNELPFKNALKAVKTRYFHYLLVIQGGHFYLNHRPAGDIWQGLYDLPLVETGNDNQIDDKTAGGFLRTAVLDIKPLKRMVHKLTHQRLEIIFYEVHALSEPRTIKNIVLTDMKGLKQYPLPKPIELFLNDYLCNPKMY